MLLKNKISEINNVVKGRTVLTAVEELYCYAQDSTNKQNVQSHPEAVVFPESIEDVQNLLKYANKHRIPVISRGAGTNMVGACTCPKGGIVLDFAKMNKILDFNPINMTVKVQPGVVLKDIKDLASNNGLFYPPDPSNFKVSTIGGSIAQSSGGAMALKYGTTKDYILSLTVVLADGTVMKLGAGTIKDAVGYHLNQLIVGSEGTLAIVVEADLKLIPKPETSRVLTAYFDDIEDAIKGATNILNSRVLPATIDFMDKNSIQTVESFNHSGMDITKEALLLVEIDGYESSMDIQEAIVIDALEKANVASFKVAVTEQEKEALWISRRASFAATAKLAPDVVSDDIIVPRENLASMIVGCNNICSKYNLKLCLVGHIGDGNIHPQIALDLNNDIEFKNYIAAKSEMYKLAIDLGGTISAEHGVGSEKISYLDLTIDNNAVKYMKMVKKIFDPNNILNPDKIFKI